MVYYAVIDTNVIVSALISPHKNSATVKTMNAIFQGTVIPVYNEKIAEEYIEVLSRGKFRNKFTFEMAKTLIQAITDNGIMLAGIPTEEPLPDPQDAVFYEVALDIRQSEDAYLVTGNTKHFPAKPFVVTPAQIVEIIEKI